MKRVLMILASCIALSGQMDAQERTDVKHYRRGLYLSVETSAGASFRDGALSQPDYGIRVATGMRFAPGFVLAVAAQGGNSLDDGTNFLPVSLHLRSDLLDRRISPYVSLDLGYAFQFGHSKCTEENILVNDGIFTERLGGLSLDEYLAQFPEGPDRDKALGDLSRFSDGSNRYISAMHEGALQFSKEGFFTELTLGAAFNLPGLDQSNVFIGLSGGLAEYAENLWLRTRTNDFVRWSGHDHLPSGERAFTEGRDGVFRDRLRAEVRLKVGFSF